MASSMDAAFGNWLAGFIDGEGCFSIRCVKQRGGTLYYGCMFSLTLRLDDAAVIEEIHRRTGIGTTHTTKAHGATGPAMRWSITSKADCQTLVALLERHPLRAKKARDFVIWRLALREQCGAKDRAKMEQLKSAITNIKRFDGGGVELPEPSPQLRLVS